MGDEFIYVGGLPCLDFANAKKRLRKWIDTADFDALLGWSIGAGTISEAEAVLLRAAAERTPKKAAKTLKRAADLSHLMCRVFSAVAEQRRPSTDDLAGLNSELVEAMSRAQVVVDGDRYGWGWSGEESEPERPLWPVIRSAAELLVSNELDRVKICPDDRCRWVFLDTSRNLRRRWCDMKVCGNRAKVRRFRAKSD